MANLCDKLPGQLVWRVDYTSCSFGQCVVRALSKRKKIWMKEYLMKREGKGSYSNIFRELQNDSGADFLNYMRMPYNFFSTLLDLVSPQIEKQDTRMRHNICAGSRLAATLRFLVTGESYSSLRYSTRISKDSLSRIIPETCSAIYHALKDRYLKVRFFIPFCV